MTLAPAVAARERSFAMACSGGASGVEAEFAQARLGSFGFFHWCHKNYVRILRAYAYDFRAVKLGRTR